MFLDNKLEYNNCIMGIKLLETKEGADRWNYAEVVEIIPMNGYIADILNSLYHGYYKFNSNIVEGITLNTIFENKNCIYHGSLLLKNDINQYNKNILTEKEKQELFKLRQLIDNENVDYIFILD